LTLQSAGVFEKSIGALYTRFVAHGKQTAGKLLLYTTSVY